MSVLRKLQSIEARRSTWEVTEPVGRPATQITPTLARVLALRHLELDVQDWTNRYLDEVAGDESEGVRAILSSHAADEDKHDRQLDILAIYWRQPAQYDGAAESLIWEWRNCQSHPLAKKLVLEAMGLFQCMTLMQITAPGDLFTQAVRQWIMFDEPAHVASARVLVRLAGVKVDRQLLDLGKRTVRWLTEDEPIDVQQQMMKVAMGILKDGRSDDANSVSTVANVEMFTQATNQRIPYTTRKY